MENFPWLMVSSEEQQQVLDEHPALGTLPSAASGKDKDNDDILCHAFPPVTCTSCWNLLQLPSGCYYSC